MPFLCVFSECCRLIASISARDDGLRFAIREGGRTDDAGVGSHH
ncbi:hypothetical protein [Psychromonas sp. CNPT3]|nr:hypothetical protein [Psychromonas sp. CNPT3]